MFCSECGGALRETREPIVEEYRGEKFTISGIRHFKCDSCGSYEIMAEDADLLSEKIADQYAERLGLLSPAQIKEARRSMGLTQVEFESLLGVSSPTCSRWENGAVQQSKTADRLIRLVANVPAAQQYLENLGKAKTASFAAEVILFVPSAGVGSRLITPSFVDAKEG